MKKRSHRAIKKRTDGEFIIILSIIAVLFVGIVIGGSSHRECSDGLDNDQDGKIDLSDSGCGSPNDPEEVNCGDGACTQGETLETCEVDCSGKPTHSICGDGKCAGDETSFDCAQDCGAAVEWPDQQTS